MHSLSYENFLQCKGVTKKVKSNPTVCEDFNSQQNPHEWLKSVIQ